jgi:hypothetical protein
MGPGANLDFVEKRTLLTLPGIEHHSSVVQPIPYHTDLSQLLIIHNSITVQELSWHVSKIQRTRV